jgi:hypothetical protein
VAQSSFPWEKPAAAGNDWEESAEDHAGQDGVYREAFLAPIRKSSDYLPKMGGASGVDLNGFSLLYGADPLYHWIGFDSPLMFAAHRAAGGMTSLYRQLGIGCERLMRAVLRDSLGLAGDQVQWSYRVSASGSEDRRTRELSLDARIAISDVADSKAAERIDRWIKGRGSALGITVPLNGAVFEVRQGYKSADAKRQNGDLANAAQAISRGYLPVLAVMSTQIDHAVRLRYLSGNWVVLMGTIGAQNPAESTFDFLREVIGYDLAAFFERNAALLRAGVETALTKLLETQ